MLRWKFGIMRRWRHCGGWKKYRPMSNMRSDYESSSWPSKALPLQHFVDVIFLDAPFRSGWNGTIKTACKGWSISVAGIGATRSRGEKTAIRKRLIGEQSPTTACAHSRRRCATYSCARVCRVTQAVVHLRLAASAGLFFLASTSPTSQGRHGCNGRVPPNFPPDWPSSRQPIPIGGPDLL